MSYRMIYHSVFVHKNMGVCDRIINSNTCEKRTKKQAESPVYNLCDRHFSVMIEDIATAPEANSTSPNFAAMWKNATTPYPRQSRLLLLWDGSLQALLWGDSICNKQRV